MKHSLKKECRRYLRDTFGLENYRPGQQAVVHALLSGRDVMCILPTGAGKSLCWQLPAVVHRGLTVVVSPLIALMRDQVQHLIKKGVAAVSLDSLQSSEERESAMKAIRQGAVRIVFVSPERLAQHGFRQLCVEVEPWMIVVDEAHCIVQWGDSFRHTYSEIADFLHVLPDRPVLCAMTATADSSMQRSIIQRLGIHSVKRVLLPYIRENLIYQVCTTLDIHNRILHICSGEPRKTVVFCATRKESECMADMLCRHGKNAAYYHAGMDRHERLAVQERFQTSEVMILCATSAFGMGIDIPDIRRVIHAHLPNDVIDYVQQSGRAGRDGMPSECILLMSPNDLIAKKKLRGEVSACLKGHPIKRWIYLQEYWHKLEQLLQVMLTSNCIPAGMAAHLGQKIAPCRQCSACRSGRLLRRIPHLRHMHEWQMRMWFLRWQRDQLARKCGCMPEQIMKEDALYCAAKRFVFPVGTDAPPEMERLLTHFRGKATYHSVPYWPD